MIITLGRPIAITEKGRRSNNEDAIFPLSDQAAEGQNLFLVCDGVGGADKGEVASALACESIPTFWSTFVGQHTPSGLINKAVRYTEARFDEYISEHPEAAGMATTLALVHAGASGITIAHIGDSRVYQFRGGQIIHRTEDHSLVNLLLKSGQITPIEAIDHPQKNVIIRAIQGAATPTEVEIALLTDVKAGDYLFICSDGVTDALSDAELSEIFSVSETPIDVKNAVLDSCLRYSKDNYSFYILPIQGVQESSGYKQLILSVLYSFI